MRKGQLVLVSVLIAVWLACGGSSGTGPSSSAPSSDILYIVTNGNVVTYSIDGSSLTATPLEQPVSLVSAPGSVIQFDPSPDDAFVYAIWVDGESRQHLSVYPVDSYGVPQNPPVQVLNASSLSQFNMHPSGRFAYMLEVTTSGAEYFADIRLFHAQTNTGTLQEDARVQGTYGPSYVWPAFLYGFSTDGKKLYDTSLVSNGSVYRERWIDLKTGALGGDSQLLSVVNREDVAIGKVIVTQFQNETNASLSYINVLQDTPKVHHPMIHCTSAMMSFCATATNVRLDVTGNYLFLTDPSTSAVHVGRIALSEKRIIDTGSSLPMTSQTPGFAFSPDGGIVYAVLAKDLSVHFYHFDRSSGSLAESGSPIPLTASAGICPAQRR